MYQPKYNKVQTYNNDTENTKNPTFTFRTFKNIAIQQIKKKNNTIVFYGLLKNGRYQIPKGKLGVYPSLFIVSAYNERERDSDSLLLIP